MKVYRDLSLEQFREHVASVRECGDHPMPTLTDAIMDAVVEVVEGFIEEAETFEDTSSSIIVRLQDGRFGLFHEWSDSSGHGCQCDAGWTVYPTLDAALLREGRP